MKCPKCNYSSGDDWAQCAGSCPMPMSPYYNPKHDVAVGQVWRYHNSNKWLIAEILEDGTVKANGISPSGTLHSYSPCVINLNNPVFKNSRNATYDGWKLFIKPHVKCSICYSDNDS